MELSLNLGVLSDVSRFSLTSDRKYEDGIYLGYVSIEGNVTARAPTDYQLSLIPIDRPPDEWIALEYGDGRDDVLNARTGVVDIMLGEVIEDSIEIVGEFGGQLNWYLRASPRQQCALSNSPASGSWLSA